MKILKLSVSLFFTFIFCISAGITTAAAGSDNFRQIRNYTADTFVDVKETDWFFQNIKAVYELGLMVGKGMGEFDTDSSVTLAETVTIAARLQALYKTGKTEFPTSDPWYQSYVDYAKYNGIADLTGMDLNAPTMRAQFAEILACALPEDELAIVNTVDDDAIPDVLTADSFGFAVYRLYRAGILTGSDMAGTFYPFSNITRAEVAAIVTRMVDPSLRKNVTLIKESKVIASGTAQSTKTFFGEQMSDGEDLYWTLSDTGIMTIKGHGSMARYEVSTHVTVNSDGTINSKYVDTRPWSDYSNQIKTVIIADGCTSIGSYSFYKCENLTNIIIPESVSDIGDLSFAFCTNLESINLPDTIEILWDDTFYHCTNLESVKLPKNLKIIHSNCFDSCCKLKELIFPETLEKVWAQALHGTGVETLYFYGNAPEIIKNDEAVTPFCNIIILDGEEYMAPINQQPTIYYIEGKNGWTSPTWTTEYGTVYNSAIFSP